MPVFGLPSNKSNPEFKDVIFEMWCPEFKAYLRKPENKVKYEYVKKELANKRVKKSCFGSDWEYAMSMCIAFYLALMIEAENKGTPSLSRLAEDLSPKGRVDSYSVGQLSKSMNFESTMLTSEEALFWNQNKYGVKLFACAKTHGTLTMAVAI